MPIETGLAYCLTAFFFSLSPGSGCVLSLSNGLNYGVRAGVLGIVGLQLGMSVHLLLVALGLGAFVAQSATAFAIIKWCGVAYLIWLGWQKWRSASLDLTLAPTAQKHWHQQVWQGVLVNLTNPKTVVFLVALLPQFLTPEGDYASQMAILALITLAVDALVMLGYVLLASRCALVLRRAPMAWINRGFGALFMGCGMLLAKARL